MPGPDADVRVAIGPLAAPVLARVVSALAARADLPLDRVSEAGLLADAVAAHARARVDDGHVRVTVAALPGELEMRVGPLVEGGAEGLLRDDDLPELGSVIMRLADEVRVERDGVREHLVLRLSSP
jgi:serine/threonine-protein kinase RsbW